MYFFSFSLIVTIVFLNLFVAIILQGFEDTESRENSFIDDKVISGFRLAWSQFDPEGSGHIKVENLEQILWMLGPPLGFSNAQKLVGHQQRDFISALELPTYNNVT